MATQLFLKISVKFINTKILSIVMSETTVVTRGSQITLTKEIRKKAGIEEGDRVILNVVGNTVTVTKRDPSVFDNIKGFLPENFDEIMKKMRTDSRERLKRLGVIK